MTEWWSDSDKNVPIISCEIYKHRVISCSKQTFVLKQKLFNLINKTWRSEFCPKLHWKMLLGLPKNQKGWNCCHIMGCLFAPYHIVKVNLIEVNVVLVNLFSRNMVAITTFKKSALKSKVPSWSPAASYVQWWALCINQPANV